MNRVSRDEAEERRVLSVVLPRYRHCHDRYACTFERDDANGEWVAFQEGRRSLNDLQSVALGLGAGSLPREELLAYRDRGICLRMWEALGSAGGNGHRLSADIFQELRKVREENERLKRQLSKAEWQLREAARVAAPPPVALPPAAPVALPPPEG